MKRKKKAKRKECWHPPLPCTLWEGWRLLTIVLRGRELRMSVFRFQPSEQLPGPVTPFPSSPICNVHAALSTTIAVVRACMHTYSHAHAMHSWMFLPASVQPNSHDLSALECVRSSRLNVTSQGSISPHASNPAKLHGRFLWTNVVLYPEGWGRQSPAALFSTSGALGYPKIPRSQNILLFFF